MTENTRLVPADWGHYGGLMIRIKLGILLERIELQTEKVERIQENQRFAPLNSWPDNANLDKSEKIVLQQSKENTKQTFLGETL